MSTTTRYWGTGNHFRIKFATSIGGIALIVVAAIAAIALTDRSDAGVGPAAAVAGPVAGYQYSNASTVLVTYYVVSTQEEADRGNSMVAVAEDATRGAGMQEAPQAAVFLVVDTPESERILQLMAEDINAYAMTNGTPTAQIIDLRPR